LKDFQELCVYYGEIGGIVDTSKVVSQNNNKKIREHLLKLQDDLIISRLSFDIYRAVQNGSTMIQIKTEEFDDWPTSESEQRDPLFGISRIFANIILKVFIKMGENYDFNISNIKSEESVKFIVITIDKMTQLLNKFVKKIMISPGFIKTYHKEMGGSIMFAGSYDSRKGDIFSAEFVNSAKKRQLSFLATFFISSMVCYYDDYKREKLAIGEETGN